MPTNLFVEHSSKNKVVDLSTPCEVILFRPLRRAEGNGVAEQTIVCEVANPLSTKKERYCVPSVFGVYRLRSVLGLCCRSPPPKKKIEVVFIRKTESFSIFLYLCCVSSDTSFKSRVVGCRIMLPSVKRKPKLTQYVVKQP